jgi:hypothetical protein
MLWLRWSVGLLLLALSGHLIVLNASVFWISHIQRRRSPSWIPLLGGVLGAAALAILPVPAVHPWWWVPFLIDWGSVPGLLETLVFHLCRWNSGSNVDSTPEMLPTQAGIPSELPAWPENEHEDR